MRAFRKINNSNRDLMQLQTNIEEQFNFLRTVPLLNGAAIVNQVLTTAATTIPHMLDRQPLGWIITDKNAAQHIHRVSWDTKNITLIASGTVTCNVWIY